MKRRVLAALIFCSLMLCTLAFGVAPWSSSAQTEDTAKPPKAQFVPGHVLVRFRPGTSLAAQGSLKRQALTLRSLKGRQIPAELQEAPGLGMVEGLRLGVVPPEETAEAIEALRSRPDVLYAEPDFIRQRDVAPNDPRYAEMWALKNTGQSGGTAGKDISAEAAWDTTTGSRSVVVGVVDEGIDINHPDLQANVWTNAGELAGNGLDDDGNGYVDDVHGWDFFHDDSSVYDNPANVAGANAPDAHGTHVAGTVGATGNNNAGVVGVNWQVSLMSLKALGSGIDPAAPSSVSTTVRAYGYAKLMRDLWVSSGGTRGANLRVLNNSYGGFGYSLAERDAIRALADSQILFVASAGNATRDNDRFPHFPSSYEEPNVIAVAATDRSDFIASFTNYGARTVHMAAPGAAILSTTPNNTYSVFNGTSMAAPHVSGAAALLCAARPDISLTQLRAALIYSGNEVASLSPTIFPPGVATGRRLNVAAALAAAAEADSAAPDAVGNFRITAQDGRSITLGWNAPGDDGGAGRASLYELRFADSAVVTTEQFEQARRLVAPLTAVAGTAQTITVKPPYRHPNGFIAIRAVDNVGNVSPVSSVPFTIDLPAADPYVVTAGAAEPLSTGGTPLGLNGDDKLKKDYVLPFLFPLFEGRGNGLTVSTNGALYFSFPPPTLPNGDAADAVSSREGLAAYRKIAGLWDDLRTDRRPGDDVYVVTPNSSTVIFRWQAVTFDTPLAPGVTRGEHPVSFEIELRRDGTIKIRYGDGNEGLLPVVGLSAGEPDTYVVESHTSETALKNLTNAPTLTFGLRNPPRLFADLIVQAKGAPNPVVTGQNLSYTIDYVSHGPESDPDVVITDQLPAGTTFVSCSGGGPCTAPPVGSGGTVTLKLNNAGTFLGVNFTIVVKVTAPGGTKLVNTVTVAGGVTEDPTPSNNTSTVTTDVFAASVFDGVKAVAAGDRHTLALKTDGKVWGWGANNAGEVTHSPDSVAATPMQTAGVSDVTAIAGGGSHSLALKGDGTVWAWGMNSNGQLGRGGGGSTIGQPAAQVNGLTGVTAVCAGYTFSAALRDDGTVWTWGDNSYGQLGDGTTTNRFAPGQVSGLNDVTTFACGQEGHMLAVKSDGTVRTWGENRFGELGDGTTQTHLTPVLIEGLTNVKAVAGGQHFGLALRQDGTVWTWGGDPGSASRPRQLTELSGITAIDAGERHGIALKSDGTVWTWGVNFDGQLGDGTSGSGGGPRQVPGLGGVVGVAAGYTHSVALLSDGTVRTWGSNTLRQLGDGTDLTSKVPVQVSGVLRVATPTIDPNGGFFTSPLNVRVASGTEGALIRYTTNGQDPTENDPSVASGGTVRLTGSCTFKARAYKDGYVTSGVSFVFFTVVNPIDTADFFVAQHYRDFLSREPDQSGLNFWTQGINACGFNFQCVEVRRINTSAAFFLSIEFQETGYLVYRTYLAAYGDIPGKPVPLTRAEFLPDTQSIGQGLVVNSPGWEQLLEANKQAYFNSLVTRPRFAAAHPTSRAPAQFVDALFQNAGVTPTAGERNAAVAEFGAAPDTSDTSARARALRRVAENTALVRQEFNRAFVLMQYFGYLRRDPDAAPEATLDFTGYNFWLGKLEQFHGNYIQAEMVKAFLSAPEYRQRFGQ
jgi:uncharacterized repeat protein (TIGR01451 family)